MKLIEDVTRIARILRYRYLAGPRVYQDVYATPRIVLPILVYQMGKVGSKSVYDSLIAAGVSAFHVHRIGKDVHPKLFRRIVEKKERAKIITLVREPFSQSISSFFQHLEAYCGSSDAASMPSDKLLHHFLHMPSEQQTPCINWFQDEFAKISGTDVFATPFCKEKGFVVIREDHDILILRSELADSQKANAIAEFLEIPPFTMIRSNGTDQSDRGRAYRRFKKEVKLPESLTKKMLDSKYSRHFF